LPLSFPCAAYELRNSSDLVLLTKWPVFLQNAFGNPAYVNQKILKLGKILGGAANGGPLPTQAPLRIATGAKGQYSSSVLEQTVGTSRSAIKN